MSFIAGAYLWYAFHKSLTSISMFLNGPNPASFCLFSFFSQCKDKYSTNLTKNGKSINGVLGTRTKDGRMEGFLAFNVKCNLCVFIFMVLFFTQRGSIFCSISIKRKSCSVVRDQSQVVTAMNVVSGLLAST